MNEFFSNFLKSNTAQWLSESPEWMSLAFLGMFALLLILLIVLLAVKIFAGLHKGHGTSEPKQKKGKKNKNETAAPVAASAAPVSVHSPVLPQPEIASAPEASGIPPVEMDALLSAAPPVSTDPAPAASEPAPTPAAPSNDKKGGKGKKKEKKRHGKRQVMAEDISDEQLIGISDAMAKDRKAPAAPKQEKKVKQKKPSKRAMRKALKAKTKKLQVPKTVQDSIPYYAVYPNKGIIETSPGVFTKSYLLQDINYQIAREDEQYNMFMEFGKLLNGFEPSVNFEITINQKNINMEEFEAQTMIPLEGDELDELRIERNEILRKKMMEGRNSLVKEKYLTVAAPADSFAAAELLFARLDAEVISNVKKIGSSEATILSVERRLEILHDVYNIGYEGMFGNNIIEQIGEDGEPEYVFAPEKFRFDIMHRMGLTTKDMVGPEVLTFKGDYGMVGDKYFRALYLKKLPSMLRDEVLYDLTNTECNMITSIHYQSIEADAARKMVTNKIRNINAGLVDKQKKAARGGYDSRLVNPELQNASEETVNLLDDISKKNQKLFYVSLVITHFADTKEQLDSDTKTIQGIARRQQLDIRKLSQQQEQGLNSALPLAYNQLSVNRVLTTESAAVFMPFVNQELNDRDGGMYYGNNAVSRNLIMFNRRNCKNGNGFIFGTSGSGKSMAAKQEMLTVYISSKDTIIVIDPEGEYYPMAELLGGEVIRIAAGSESHINPFDIDMGTDSKDNPMAIKIESILSLCEAAVTGQYSGLNPPQRGIIDRCVREIYKPFMEHHEKTGEWDKSKIPTLLDFYKELRGQGGYDAGNLADSLEIYATGSLNLFAHKTNVDYKKRFVVFDIKDVGATMKTMALQVILDHVWNRMVEGRNDGQFTWLFIDEIYLLFKTQASAEFLRNFYKRARKYFGIPTGITQNVEDLLKDETARTMLSNSEYIQMLNQSHQDREELAMLLSISNAQLQYVTNRNPGEGLLFNGRVIVPFINELPKETKQYLAMTTKPDEMKERDKKKAEQSRINSDAESTAPTTEPEETPIEQAEQAQV